MRKMIVLNLKSNLTLDEYKEYLKKLQNVKYPFVLAPSYPYLALTKDFTLASQNISPFKMGSYTGEVSGEMLKSLNVKYAIIGHSERIKYFNENGKILREKIKRCLENDITPILCMSETFDVTKGVSNNIVQKLNNVIGRLSKSEREKVIIAYEPYWAVGTNKMPTQECLNKIFGKIKENFKENKVLYGGSVNLETIDTLKKITLIDGYLIGSLSLDINELCKLLEKI